ncbi:hypothetical protein ASF98_14100 [Arthrobacter sp. Leaf337]|uniref:hypothetical protein n=1 Tax=Arthrobacter sp. Leaf337 TaxID=1736342 RepID=UPI0006F5FC48|nr:hypothetical protein [Arthrobacter sp. Leaf337]KQR62719.1 hypothetical protein ASF98_14100 [Arthrobacter sp. Leaf337]
MIRTIEAGRTYFVESTDPRLIDTELSAAVEQARQHAMEEGRCGILVTRLGHTTFTVAVSEDVPFGETLERQGPTTTPGNAQGDAARSS